MITFAIQAQVSQVEREALIAFYNATDGDNWADNTNWDTDPNSNSDVSTWFGVTLYSSGINKVRTITLRGNNLSGSLPDLVNLSRLQQLDVGQNNITGTVDVNKLPNSLVNFRLDYNSFSGNVPNMSSFNKLYQVLFNNNSFEGTVSPSLFPTTIGNIWVGNNNLSGELDLSLFSNLNAINIRDTDISFL